MFKSRYYKKVKEYTEEEKQAYREQKEKERLENNIIVFNFEKSYLFNMREYKEDILKVEFVYRADKVAAVKSLNTQEKIAIYDADIKCWYIKLNKITDYAVFNEAFSNFDIRFLHYDMCAEDLIKYEELIRNIYSLMKKNGIEKINSLNIEDTLNNDLLKAKQLISDRA